MPEPATATPVLATHYYRDNFFRLLDTVQEQYGDLLLPAERDLLQRLGEAPFPAQCLYVRLVSRVGPWFREARLAYPELGDCGPLLDELLARDLALQPAALALEELAGLYTRDELARAFGQQPARKADLLAAIAALEHSGEQLYATVTALDDARIVAPAGADSVALFQLLFFGNRRQSLTDFVLSDLGVARYYPYELDRSRRLFATREAVDEYMLFAALGDMWLQVRDASDGERNSGPPADSWRCVRDVERSEVGSWRTPVPGRARPGTARPAPREPELPWMALLRPRNGGAPVPDRVARTIEIARAVLECPANYATSRPRRDRLCNTLARQLEREDEPELALALYRDSDTHPARERAARVLERLGETREALALAETALADPRCEEERDAMGRIATRLRRTPGERPDKRAPDRFDTLDLALPQGDTRVELAVAAHLAPQWEGVHYVENSLMNALFGLAFWEEIFAPVPGAFNNPFQGAPADMYDPAFAIVRRELIEARLAALAAADLARELPRAYRARCGYQCHWVDWRGIDEALVARAAAVIPAGHLLAIWRRMLFDPRENRRGFPDLLALGSGPGEYCMIEVKGPGDTLQESQKRWLRFFRDRGIPAAVARVSWRDE